MKRLHIHLSVKELAPSIAFYSKLFGRAPSVTKDDYAKWMIEDPRMNFAVSTRTGKSELEHFGIQVDTDMELENIRAHLAQEGIAVKDEGETVCCYMHSEKSWIQDPDSFPWEIYRSMKEAQYFNSERQNKSASACCAPSANKSTSGCC